MTRPSLGDAASDIRKGPIKLQPRTVLGEIGFWSLPTPVCAASAEDLAAIGREVFEGEGLAAARISAWVTGRRITLMAEGVPDSSGVRQIEVRGPKASQAYDFSGNPTHALYGFATDQQVETNAIFIREVDGEKYLFVRKEQPGQDLGSLLPELIDRWLQQLPFQASPWAPGSLLPAPPQWVVLMIDDQVVETDIEGVVAGRDSQHWVLDHFESVPITHASEYVAALSRVGVELSAERRSRRINLELMEHLAADETRLRDRPLLERVVQRFEKPAPTIFALPERARTLPDIVAETALAEFGEYLPIHLAQGGLAGRALGFLDGTVPDQSPRCPADVRIAGAAVAGNGIAPGPAESASIPGQRPPLWSVTLEQFFDGVVADWQRTLALPMAELVVRLQELPALDGHGSLSENALRLARLGHWLVGAAGLTLARDSIDQACMFLFIERFTPSGRRFPALAGHIVPLLAKAQGVAPEVAEAVEAWWSAGGERARPARRSRVAPIGVEPTSGSGGCRTDAPLTVVLGLVQALDQFATAVARDSDRLDEFGERLIETWLQAGIQANVLALPEDLLNAYPWANRDGAGSVCDRWAKAWHALFARILAQRFPAGQANDLLANLRSVDPGACLAAASAWQHELPPVLPVLAGLWQRLQARLGDHPTPSMPLPPPDDLLPQERSLRTALAAGEGWTWTDPVAAVGRLAAIRPDVEACLIDLPPIIDDEDPVMRRRLDLLARVRQLFVVFPPDRLSALLVTDGAVEPPSGCMSPEPKGEPRRDPVAP